MRIRVDELRKHDRAVAPPPPPIEPLLSAVQEAEQIAKDKGNDPVIAARRARVLRLIRRPATPEGADAELVALLANARALPLEKREDWVAARQRLAGIGSLKDPPPEVRKLLTKLHVSFGDGTAFADALLPKGRQGTEPFHEGDFGSNLPPGP